MAFEKEKTRIPVGIGEIEIHIIDPNPDIGEPLRATFRLEVLMSDGSVVVRAGNLEPHTSSQQKTSHANFMANLRAKAVAELLP